MDESAFELVQRRMGHVPTVGRERELAAIERVIRHALAGESHVLFLAGPAGIGKSRLLADAARITSELGGLAAFGRCLDEQGMPPLVPWIDALTSLDDQLLHNRSAGSLAPPATRLTSILTDGLSPDSTSFEHIAPDQHAFRIAITLVRALEAVAQAIPLVILFDDLQWMDATSARLLRLLANYFGPSRLVILGAYRDERIAGNPEVRRSLDELDRQRRSTTIELHPIAEEDTERLVSGLLGASRPDLGHAIHEQAEGNPFAVEELARAVTAEVQRRPAECAAELLPEAGVAALIRRRFEQLKEPARAIIDVAALAGSDISLDLLARATNQPVAEIVCGLDEGVRAALIMPAGVDAEASADVVYRFRHDRIRETIDAQINPARRQAIHARLAAAIETSDHEADPLRRSALLLHHLLRAHAALPAAEAAERLARAASRAHLSERAAEAYGTALSLRRGLAQGIRPDEEARLLVLRGEALVAASHPVAISTLTEAERCALDAGDFLLAGRARYLRGRAHARREEHELAVETLRSAISTLQAAGAGLQDLLQAKIVLVAVLGTSLAAYDEAIALANAALEDIAREPVEPALEAAIRLELAKTLMRAGSLAEGKAQLMPALALALSGNHLELAAEISGALANYAYWTGDLDASERDARNRRDYAQQAGDPFALRHVRSWLANIAISRGDWLAARELIAEAGADVARIDSPEPAAFLQHLNGLIALAQGRFEEAVDWFEAAMSGFRQAGPAMLPWYLGCLAHAYQLAGDLTAAAQTTDEVERAIAALPAGSLPAAPALAQLGIVAVYRNDRPAAQQWYDALLPYAGQHHWVLIDRVLGMLAAAIGNGLSARRHFAGAISTALACGLRPELALAMGERTIASARDGNDETLHIEQEQAIARLRALGMDGAVQRLAILASAVIDPAETSTGLPGGLTERETEVLRLVAEGLTNREIGERLHISEKTVINHLTHIYTKAGIENRAGAVMFAVRHGLI